MIYDRRRFAEALYKIIAGTDLPSSGYNSSIFSQPPKPVSSDNEAGSTSRRRFLYGAATATAIAAGIRGLEWATSPSKSVSPAHVSITGKAPNPALKLNDLVLRHKPILPTYIDAVGEGVKYVAYKGQFDAKFSDDSPLVVMRYTHPKKVLGSDGPLYERAEHISIDWGTGKPVKFRVDGKGEMAFKDFNEEQRIQVERKALETLEALTRSIENKARAIVSNSEKS